MGDSWLQRLVIRGPASEVTAFQRAAASRKKPQYWTVTPAWRTQKLSFVVLRDMLLRKGAHRFDGELEEPWDLTVAPARRLKDGSREATYGFQLSAFEPDELIIEISRLYPRLCFVLGCVASNVDEQSSRLIQRGRSWRWQLPVRRKEAIFRALVQAETNDDEAFWGEVEADWQMMDEVVAHWRPKMDTLVARLLGRTRATRAGRKARA